MITPYVTINTRKEFTRNKTGFGYMVYDIAKSVGELEDVDVLCTDSRGEGFEMEGVKYLQRSFILFAKLLFQGVSLGIVIRMWRKYHISKGLLIRMVYYWIMSGYIVSLLKKNRYDIVHIHQSVYETELWMAVCNKANINFLVTLHGLNSFSDTVKLEAGGKLYERDMLQRVVNGEFPITVISSGMLRTIEKTYHVAERENISVVCNAFSFAGNKEKYIDVRLLYSIPPNAKIILYAGNISQNKNQVQLVRAFDLMRSELCENTWVLFCGLDLSYGDVLRESIIASQYSKHFILCGDVNKERMPSYFKAADGVVLLSVAEGFGLSLIEGMHFGKPCMMFSDLDAFEDIYNEKAVIAIDKRTDNAVAEGVEMLLGKEWIEEEIRAWSIKFESSTMAYNYINTYKKILAV